MKLVLVHGRDQQGKNKDALKKQWIDTLKKGLQDEDLDDSLVVEFPFYGDILEEMVRKSRISKPVEAVARGEMAAEQNEFFTDFLADLQQNSRLSDVAVDSEVLEMGTPIERGALNWPWLIRLMRVLDNTWLGPISVEQFTYDVFMYLTDPVIRDTINSLVTQAIANAPCVVVGHSLGTIVCYDALSKMQDRTIVKDFITLGSPLGIRTVKKHLEPPLNMPVLSGNWYNAYDKRDFVALNPLDRTHFGITPPILNNGLVKNQTSNHHGIEGYLNNSAVATRILTSLRSIPK